MASRLWKDESFPHSDRSIGSYGRHVEWVPARELANGHCKLFEGIDPGDLLQGEVGNCWLIAAMSCLAEFPDAVKKLFSRDSLSPDGKYTLSLYDDKRDRLVDVKIDEYIPVRKRGWLPEGPIFAKPNGNEIWVLLLEKAMAKLYGNYEELCGGNVATAFRTFTGVHNIFMWKRGGARWQKWELRKGERSYVSHSGMESTDSDELFNRLHGYDLSNYMMGASISPTRRQEYERSDGLIEGHAYSLLQVIAVDGQRLLMLRNPWGNHKEWNGTWSDGDRAWKQHPRVKAHVEPKFADDGAFWMSWEDFRCIFDSIDVCGHAMREGQAAADHTSSSTKGKSCGYLANGGESPKPEAPSQQSPGFLPENGSKELVPGCAVRIHGLKNAADLNGQCGTLDMFIPSSRRWRVMFGPSAVKDIKPVNLLRVEPEDVPSSRVVPAVRPPRPLPRTNPDVPPPGKRVVSRAEKQTITEFIQNGKRTKLTIKEFKITYDDGTVEQWELEEKDECENGDRTPFRPPPRLPHGGEAKPPRPPAGERATSNARNRTSTVQVNISGGELNEEHLRALKAQLGSELFAEAFGGGVDPMLEGRQRRASSRTAEAFSGSAEPTFEGRQHRSSSRASSRTCTSGYRKHASNTTTSTFVSSGELSGEQLRALKSQLGENIFAEAFGGGAERSSSRPRHRDSSQTRAVTHTSSDVRRVIVDGVRVA